MSYITYPSSSPYAFTSQTSWYLGNFVFRPVASDSGDTLMTLDARYQYRPDKLSQDLYGSPAYWWVFCVRNPFLRKDPVWAFTAGTQIVVPSAAFIQQTAG